MSCVNVSLPLLQKKAVEVRSQKGQLKRIEDLGAAMEERLILDNRSVQGLGCMGHRQAWVRQQVGAGAGVYGTPTGMGPTTGRCRGWGVWDTDRHGAGGGKTSVPNT